MKETSLLKLKKLLIKRRREIFGQTAHLEAEGAELVKRFIEPIDSAQKEDLAWIVHKLDARGKEEIQEINLALDKMQSVIMEYVNCAAY